MGSSGRAGVALVVLAGCGFVGDGPPGTGDAKSPDADGDAAPAARCGGPDDDTIALYTFDEPASLADATGDHPGTVFGGGEIVAVAGPPDCGMAVEFPQSPPAAILVADSPAFDLAEGSIDLWFRGLAPPTNYYGILSRDAQFQALPGHITVYEMNEGRIMARLQGGGANVYLCSDDPVEAGRWYHLGINFGGGAPELWIDGVRATFTGTVDLNVPVPCGGQATLSIAGNDNPLVIGANEHAADEGTGNLIEDYLRGGALDHVRISRVRRAFAAP